MSEHERLVSAALNRAEHRRQQHRRQPDDVLAVEVLRLRGQLAEQRTIHAKREEPPGIAAVRLGLIRALEYWRWCWDCGTTDRDCRALGRPCCPDCRHRDAGNRALGRVLTSPAS